MSPQEYINAELDRVEMDGEFPSTVKFHSGTGDTRFLSLTQENAEAIIEYLQKKFLTEES